MPAFTFQKEHVVSKDWLKIRSKMFMNDDTIVVKSYHSGEFKVFEFDDIRTAMMAERNEWWDGEEKHRLYNDITGDGITLEVWCSAYD